MLACTLHYTTLALLPWLILYYAFISIGHNSCTVHSEAPYTVFVPYWASLNQRPPIVESAPALNPACNKAHVISNRALLQTVATSKWNKQPLCHPWCCVTLHLKTSSTDTTQLTRHLRKQPFPAQTCRDFSRSVLFPPWGDRGECKAALRRRTGEIARI